VGTAARARPGGTLAAVAAAGAIRRVASWRDGVALLATVAGQRRLAWTLTSLLIVLDCLLVGRHALAIHLSYHTYAFDLGNMDQAVWNTLHGHPFRFTNRGIDWYGPPTRLALHVEPILLLLAPLYLVHAGAETLLVAQTVALALGAVPLLALSLRRMPDAPLLGVGFAAAYLAAPEILGEALFDFHPVALATPLLLAAIWALDAGRYRWFLAAAVLAAAGKEDVALALVPLGAFIALRRGRPRLGWSVALGSVAWTALCFLVIIPHFNHGTSTGGNPFWYRYTDLGDSPSIAIGRLVHDPLSLLPVVSSPAKRGYVALLLRTGGGLGILAPFWWLAALPELAINLLSTQPAQYSGFYQYNAVLLAVLSASAVYGTALLRQARRDALAGAARPATDAAPRSPAGRIQRAVGGWMALIGRLPLPPRLIPPLVVAWLLAGAMLNLAAIRPTLDGFWQTGPASSDPARVGALLRQIPADAVVAATDTLDPHLSDRETIYLLSDPQAYTAAYVAVDLSTVPGPWQQEETKVYASMASSGHYRIVGVTGSVVVLRRVGAPLTAG
jgi:uncharacterized membrane protein